MSVLGSRDVRLDLGEDNRANCGNSPKGRCRMALFEWFINLITRFRLPWRSTHPIRSPRDAADRRDTVEQSPATSADERRKNVYPLF